jgi:hypothetical protein
MTENEKTVMFEAEIVRVGRLIDAAVAMYRTATPEDVASVFHEYEELMAQFEADRFVDERIAKKTIVLLGFLYLSADTVLQQIKSELNNLESSQDPFSFMRTQLKLARFSEDTYTPIANALALHIRAFIDQRGEERFETFMRENRLDGVLRKLE